MADADTIIDPDEETRLNPAIIETDYQTRLGLEYSPSIYQSAIFDFIVNGRGHGVVEAVAGSGKTTTIVSAARLLTGDGLFVAFNKVIADMLSQKLRGTQLRASTVHSHGFAAIRDAVGRCKVDGRKYKDRIRDIRDAAKADDYLALGRSGRRLTRTEILAIEDDGFPSTAVGKLLDLARLDLVDPRDDDFADSIMGLADHHNIDTLGMPDLVIECVAKLMMWGWDNTQTIDFTDMVWLPTANGYSPTRYAWVFVDECQDISRAHLALIKASLRQGGRALFVGDRRQAIYGFAGADSDSFQRIIDTTSATVLPLSVCYRCPTTVIELAREFCPQIEAREGAPAGTVRDCTRDEFVESAREGDMVLCRINAPLLALCFALIGEGISAAVRGRDIGEGLVKVVKTCAKRLADFADFGLRLDAWEDKEIDVARRRYKDEDALASRIEYLNDQAECIRIIFARSGAKSEADLKAAIGELFADETPSVVLSSVHRAKGLEADRVFIAKPERLGVARPGAKPWMVEQENNLAYVAITRAQSEYIEITDADDA